MPQSLRRCVSRAGGKICLQGHAARQRVEYVRRVSRLWSFARSHGFDLLIVVAALGGALEVVFGHNAPAEADTTAWFAAPAVALTVLPLLGRRRFPFAAPAGVWLISGAVSFVDGSIPTAHPSVFAAGMAAAFLLGGLPDPVRGRLGLAVVLGGIAAIVYNDPEQSPGELVFTPALFAIAWLVGYALRERVVEAQAAEQRAAHAEGDARRAVFEERVRIARELHDVIAHHVSMMGVQAGAGRLVIDRDPAKAKEALAAIELSSRHAVQELYRLLGFLRQEGDPDPLASQPGLGQLASLAAGMSNAELAVEVSVEGEQRPLPATVDVSAYRIVQEALTNALKHGGASRADVHLRYWPDELEVEVIDDGRKNGGPVATSGGLGMIGMRERAALHGGHLSAGPAAGGGFAVRVKLPTPEGAL
jgi:signal transduction histidine kinase